MANNFNFTETYLIEAYRKYRQAIKEFVEKTGYEFELNQTISSTEEDAAHRNIIVGELCKIDEEYNS